MMANASCDRPRNVPRLALTPTTRKWTPSIQRIDGAEQPVGDFPADHHDRVRACDL
jgi:hypothetical protein